MSEETKKSKEKTEKKNNIAIKDLEALREEYIEGEMPDRKVSALRVRLIELYLGKEATKDELSLMETMLLRDRRQGQLSYANEEILNRIEMDRCDKVCVVHAEHPPQVHYLSKDLECKYRHDHAEGRYAVYVPRTIKPAWQYDLELAEKIVEKRPVDESEYPKTKILIHRLYLTKKEFDAWFVKIEDELKPKKKAEEVYTF